MALISSFGHNSDSEPTLAHQFIRCGVNVNHISNWSTYKYPCGVPGHIGLLLQSQSDRSIVFLIELALPRDSIWDLILPKKDMKICVLYRKFVIGENINQSQMAKLQAMDTICSKSILDIQNASEQCIKKWKVYSLIFFNCRHFVSRLNAMLTGQDPDFLTKYWFNLALKLGCLGITFKVGEGLFSYLKNSTSNKMLYYRFTIINKSFRIVFRVWRFGIFVSGLYGVGQIMHQMDNPKDSRNIKIGKSMLHTAMFGVGMLFFYKFGRKMIKKISWDLKKINEAKYAELLPELSLSKWFDSKLLKSVSKVSVDKNVTAFGIMSLYLLYQLLK